MAWVKSVVIATALICGSGCAAIEQSTVSSRPANIDTYVSVGDVVVRIDVTENLPNAYGRADIFGRQRARGFSEIRYIGLSSRGWPVFQRRDVDIQTNETTMNTFGFGTAVVKAQPSGSGIVGTGIYTQAQAPSIQALPPDTIQFELDLTQSRIITIRDTTIEILDVNASGVRFVVR